MKMMRRLMPRRSAMPLTQPFTALSADSTSANRRRWHKGRHPFSHQGFATERPQGATEFELSVGKIVDTLRADYPALLERSPDFDIYDEGVVFELNLGAAFEGSPLSALRGKKAYRRALLTVQTIANTAVRDGRVECSVHVGHHDHTLRVKWSCNGQIIALAQPLYIDAISLYSIAPHASVCEATRVALHRIDRHKIEFLEVHPPSLRDMLRGMWIPQVQMAEPSLALDGRQFESHYESPAKHPPASLV